MLSSAARASLATLVMDRLRTTAEQAATSAVASGRKGPRVLLLSAIARSERFRRSAPSQPAAPGRTLGG